MTRLSFGHILDGLKINLKKYSSNYKTLPIGTKRILSLGMILTVLVALPILVITIVTTKTNFFNRAATGEISGEPPSPTPIPTTTVSASPIPTPIPTMLDFHILLKLKGVDDGSADQAKVTVKFNSSLIDVNNKLGVITSPIAIYYVKDGVYNLSFGILGNSMPNANDYSIVLKGEKHLATRFCQEQGQTQHCSGSGRITIAADPTKTFNDVYLDFTGLPLEPGDLYPQDGVADRNDFGKIIDLLSKPCSKLTDQDKLTGDLNYDGCVNIRDAFLMRQALETRYDEY